MDFTPAGGHHCAGQTAIVPGLVISKLMS